MRCITELLCGVEISKDQASPCQGVSRMAQALDEELIGYSFHDKYINNLLIQQLSKNTEEDNPKKLLIVNPSNKDKTENQVAEELRQIQDSKSINDVINFKQISPDRIKLIPKTATEFYSEYFSNNAALLLAELEEAEQADKIF
jgi:hypothetical protein